MKTARFKLAGAILALALGAFALPALAAPDCPASGCTSAEVGPFMQGISEACGERGTCTLTDIQSVFANVGNFVLGIVGALVLLAYVVGGFYFLISGMPGMEKYREKGKTALRMSTMGLVIVFVAWAGIQTIVSVATGGGSLGSDGESWYVCGPGSKNEGLACGLNSTCTETGACVSECEQRNVALDEANGVLEFYTCVDVDLKDQNYGMGPDWYPQGSAETGLCPGPENIQCVKFGVLY